MDYFYLHIPDPQCHCVPNLSILESHQYGMVNLELYFGVEFLQTLFDGLTRDISSLCETVYLITLSSDSGVKPIGLPVIDSSFVN